MDDCFIHIATLSGIVPMPFVIKRKCLRNAHGIAFASATTIASFYQIFLRDEDKSTLTVMNMTVKFLATFLIVNAVLRINVLQCEDFDEIRTLFKRSNQLLSVQLSQFPAQHILIKAIVIYAFFSVLEYLEIFVWSPDGPNYDTAYNALLNFYVLTVNALNWSILKDMRIRLECLNATIDDFSTAPTILRIPSCKPVENPYPSNVHVNIIRVKTNTFLEEQCVKPDVQLWSKVHMLINKLAANYNQLFGWHIFMLMICVMLVLLMPLQEFLQYNVSLNVDSLNLILLTGFQIMEMIMIVKQCDKVTGQARVTTLTAYEAMHHCVEETDRKDVIRFAQQTGTQFAQFSAAGFFTVDNSVLFTMMQLITTYVIVLIQFQETKPQT